MIIEEQFYEEYASMCKTIINPIRLHIIESIGSGKLNVSEIQARMNNISLSNLSNHLGALYRVGVLSREKKGNFIYYFLMEPELLEVLKKMKNVIGSIASKRNKMMLENMPGEFEDSNNNSPE
ncbi:MAG TPA: metalloregulator ArsR/SmtB family transcription factor [Candidatus Deferrimicrobium sp.]|nr:metalloregulator ArsR/SmtB family transcription factor [Candidatus Kapabacteria bacterium]HLP62318.1 metalloregulator ArsR/SmtB family transcription factor [Candidatus Deferrimicrobium sp.]